MKKSSSIVIGIVILVVLIGGGFAIFHKSKKPASSTTTASQANVPAVNNAVLTTKTNASLGQYLADPSGKALYTYGGDTSGVSNCTGTCLENWPAYQATGSTANLPAGVSTIKRSDNGQTQYTYNGMPLYYFVNDGSGQVTGDGVSNFSVAKPAATASSTSSSSSSATTPTNSSQSSSGYPY